MPLRHSAAIISSKEFAWILPIWFEVQRARIRLPKSEKMESHYSRRYEAVYCQLYYMKRKVVPATRSLFSLSILCLISTTSYFRFKFISISARLYPKFMSTSPQLHENFFSISSQPNLIFTAQLHTSPNKRTSTENS